MTRLVTSHDIGGTDELAENGSADMAARLRLLLIEARLKHWADTSDLTPIDPITEPRP